MEEVIERKNAIACANCGISTAEAPEKYSWYSVCAKCGRSSFWRIRLYEEWSDVRVSRLVRAYTSVRKKYSIENVGAAEWRLLGVCIRCSPENIPKKICGFIYIYDRIRNIHMDDAKRLTTMKIGKNILFNWDYTKWLGIGVRGIAYFPNAFKAFEDNEENK